jgi:hypothetical protein
MKEDQYGANAREHAIDDETAQVSLGETTPHGGPCCPDERLDAVHQRRGPREHGLEDHGHQHHEDQRAPHAVQRNRVDAITGREQRIHATCHRARDDLGDPAVAHLRLEATRHETFESQGLRGTADRGLDTGHAGHVRLRFRDAKQSHGFHVRGDGRQAVGDEQ